MRMIRTAAGLALTSLCAIAHSADLVLVNAKVTTLDEHRPAASAFAIKNGKFVAVGEEAEGRKLESAGAKTIDAGNASSSNKRCAALRT